MCLFSYVEQAAGDAEISQLRQKGITVQHAAVGMADVKHRGRAADFKQNNKV